MGGKASFARSQTVGSAQKTRLGQRLNTNSYYYASKPAKPLGLGSVNKMNLYAIPHSR